MMMAIEQDPERGSQKLMDFEFPAFGKTWRFQGG